MIKEMSMEVFLSILVRIYYIIKILWILNFLIILKVREPTYF